MVGWGSGYFSRVESVTRKENSKRQLSEESFLFHW